MSACNPPHCSDCNSRMPCDSLMTCVVRSVNLPTASHGVCSSRKIPAAAWMRSTASGMNHAFLIVLDEIDDEAIELLGVLDHRPVTAAIDQHQSRVRDMRDHQ